MQLGLFSLMTLRDHPEGVRGVMRDTQTMVKTAEEAGFDIAWFAEHHFANYSSSPSPLIMAANAAAWTSKIKLAPGVLVLPLYHPLRLAQEIAAVDALSDGRLVLGLGTGYQQYEFDRYHVALTDKIDIFLEYWEVIEQALVNGEVDYRGKYITIPHTRFAIKSYQQPLPQLYVTSSHPRLLNRFKQWRAVPFLAASTLGSPALYKMVDGLNQSWETLGENPASRPLAIMQYVHVTGSRKEALEAAERARYVGRMAYHLRNAQLPLDETGYIRNEAFPGENTLEEYAENMIIGDPYHVAEHMIADIKRLNPDNYTCNFQFGCMPIEQARQSLHRFSQEVLPLIEKELGPISDIGNKPGIII